MKTIELSLRDRILYIGNEIPAALVKDKRNKFIALGYPQEVIDETADISMVKKVDDLNDIIKTQCSNGNWNYDPYMQGLANGLIMAEHLISGKEGTPEFLEAPKKWLKDLPGFWIKLKWRLFGVPTSSQVLSNEKD